MKVMCKYGTIAYIRNIKYLLKILTDDITTLEIVISYGDVPLKHIFTTQLIATTDQDISWDAFQSHIKRLGLYRI